MPSYHYRKSHCEYKTAVRSSYRHNGISYTGKITSLYWIRALIWIVLSETSTETLVSGIVPIRTRQILPNFGSWAHEVFVKLVPGSMIYSHSFACFFIVCLCIDSSHMTYLPILFRVVSRASGKMISHHYSDVTWAPWSIPSATKVFAWF